MRDDRAAGASNIDDVLVNVQRLLEEGQARKAMDLISRCHVDSVWLRNASAVCQLHLGESQAAVDALRPLVIKSGVILRDDVPAALKLNLAIALLGTGNLDGFLSMLDEVKDEHHPQASRYRGAYERWKASLSLWSRFKLALGGQAARPFAFDFPPGELR